MLITGLITIRIFSIYFSYLIETTPPLHHLKTLQALNYEFTGTKPIVYCL